MKKLLAFLFTLIPILCFVGCHRYIPLDEPDEDIFKAKDYAVSVFNDTMPNDCTIVSVTASIGDNADDSVYDIKITYTTRDDGDFSYFYKICVDGADFSILEEGAG